MGRFIFRKRVKPWRLRAVVAKSGQHAGALVRSMPWLLQLLRRPIQNSVGHTVRRMPRHLHHRHVFVPIFVGVDFIGFRILRVFLVFLLFNSQTVVLLRHLGLVAPLQCATNDRCRHHCVLPRRHRDLPERLRMGLHDRRTSVAIAFRSRMLAFWVSQVRSLQLRLLYPKLTHLVLFLLFFFVCRHLYFALVRPAAVVVFVFFLLEFFEQPNGHFDLLPQLRRPALAYGVGIVFVRIIAFILRVGDPRQAIEIYRASDVVDHLQIEHRIR
mmetsp:Transcript_98736/g.279152  ORF Transcript_98736/g.279152 Transcript_98736/m.279152 type:complete len:270 (-) Transcript_98736:123-932(-)